MCSNSRNFFVQPLQVAGHHELAADDAGLVRAALLGRCLLSWITLAPARKVMTALGHSKSSTPARSTAWRILVNITKISQATALGPNKRRLFPAIKRIAGPRPRRNRH
jgi:hypothetical protein